MKNKSVLIFGLVFCVAVASIQASLAAEAIRGSLDCEVKLTPTQTLKVSAQVDTLGKSLQKKVKDVVLTLGSERISLQAQKTGIYGASAGAIWYDASAMTPVSLSGVSAQSLTAVSIAAPLSNDNEGGEWVTNKAIIKIRTNTLFGESLDDGFGQVTETRSAFCILN